MPFSIRPSRRFPVCCPVTYQCGDFKGDGTIWNLSLTGWRLLRHYSPNWKLMLPSFGARAQSAPTPERYPQVKAHNLYTRFLWHSQAYLA